ncbi:hypothetical protein COLO4_21541 [Corchorus olitorius]|uniref:Uncharacterized protein n=1 Tax=Corchorus olitorius TaxID=93759 RepID=A0A1R3ISS4_9ROSI|nr:hypothetical protein COLO4_21541 [Corchorus olitorius]
MALVSGRANCKKFLKKLKKSNCDVAWVNTGSLNSYGGSSHGSDTMEIMIHINTNAPGGRSEVGPVMNSDGSERALDWLVLCGSSFPQYKKPNVYGLGL